MVRTLLIDNYDSFTYNLYQYLATINKCEPIVIKNDAMTWDEVLQLEFDNIVISPGPGRPQREEDLGISAEAILKAGVPVLGVCLGHQAIAYLYGGNVDLAVRPMHGRIDTVRHEGADLFAGIPREFDVVRYHSLAVTDLPADFEPAAWTSDGTLMAFHHRARPLWGVQFHPESVCTDHGKRLLENFRALTLKWRETGTARADTAMDSEARSGEARVAHARELSACPDAEAAFMTLYQGSETCFWLDSSLVIQGRSRYSYMGDLSGPNAHVVSYNCSRRELAIEAHGKRETCGQSIFEFLKERLASAQVPSRLPFDFVGGYVGYFGYELKAELEGQRGADSPLPDAKWIFADRFIAFDHVDQRAWLVCVDGPTPSKANESWFDRIAAKLAGPLLAQLPARSEDCAANLKNLRWRHSLDEYRELILRCQEEIRQGETYEVCLTNQLVATGMVDSLDLYRHLRAKNPAPYSAFLRFPDVSVLCTSPELFLKLQPDGTLDTKPIKGTAPRGSSPTEDAAIAREMAADEKTRAENLMIVDLLRNDLNKVCEIGSVHVPLLFDVESYATVHQLVSTVRGKLRQGLTIVDCVRATFPGGSMTGAPKVRTMQILDNLEAGPRGIYSGSIGYLSLGGAATLNIVIRTMVVQQDQISIGSGGAIIALSEPDAEVAEIRLKAKAHADVLRKAGAAIEGWMESGEVEACQ